MVIICSFVHRLWWGTPPDPVPTLSTSLCASCPQSPQASCQENLPLFSLMLSPGGSPHIGSRRAPPILSPGRFLSLRSVDILGSGIPCSGSCPMCCGIFSSITYLSQLDTSLTFPSCYNGRCGPEPCVPSGVSLNRGHSSSVKMLTLSLPRHSRPCWCSGPGLHRKLTVFQSISLLLQLHICGQWVLSPMDSPDPL